MKIVYHPGLTFGSATLNHFHPFEFNRAVLALESIQQVLGPSFSDILIQPAESLELDDLSLVHTPEYLRSLRTSATVAKVVEVPFLRWCPSSWIDRWFRVPAAWSVTCSIAAARLTLTEQCAVSLGGGFHHAKRSGGEGFCLVNDIAYVIELLRQEKLLQEDERWIYIDLDVHQGNGVSDYYKSDDRVTILDAYNRNIYPVYGQSMQGEVEIPIELADNCNDQRYLAQLEDGLERLKPHLKSAKFMIYNAGSDIFAGDRLGGLSVSREGVGQRDKLILQLAKHHNIPLLVLASGGYSKMSATLLADLALSAYHVFGKNQT